MSHKLRLSRLRHPSRLTAVGVDNGGTWIRLKGVNARGRIVWSLREPSPTVDKLPDFLRKHLKAFKGDMLHLTVGSRGVWKRSKRVVLKNALRGLAKKIVVMSDVEAAWLAAFGERGAGIVVISGTGSIGFGRTRIGHWARAGGLGPDKGDEGSGYWIGKQWLNQGTKNLGSKHVRDIAGKAPLVIGMAKKGDRIASDIILEAQNHLAELVTHINRKLHWKSKVPLSMCGSILENDWFRRGFFRALSDKKIRFRFVARKMDPATAMAFLRV